MIAYTSILWPEAESPQLNIPLPPEEDLPNQGLIDSLREELLHSLSRKHNRAIEAKHLLALLVHLQILKHADI